MFRDPFNDKWWLFILERFFGVRQNDQDRKLDYLTEIISDASESVLSAVGNIDSAELWSNEKVIDAFDKTLDDRAGDGGVVIEFIVDKNSLPSNERLRRLYEEGKIKISLYPSTLPAHFTVVDGKHVRLEDKHEANQPNHAWIRKNTMMLGRRLTMDFAELKRNTVPVEVTEIEDEA